MQRWRDGVVALFMTVALLRGAKRVALRAVALLLLAATVAVVYVQPQTDESPLVVLPLLLFAFATPASWGLVVALATSVAVALAQHAVHAGVGSRNVGTDVFFHVFAYCSVVAVVAYIQLRLRESERVAVANAALYRREREISRILQRAVLPLALPAIPDVALDAVYIPATEELEIGGDWYDAFLLDDCHMLVCVGDVMGHDVRSATIMARLQQATRTLAYEGLLPYEILARLNAMLMRERDAYATALLALIDLRDGTVRYAAGGHPPPLICGHGSVRALESRGLLLGAADDRYEDRVERLAVGETLALYSDGLVEADRDLPSGVRRLRDVLAGLDGEPMSAQAIAERVVTAASRRDDVTLLVATRRGAAACA